MTVEARLVALLLSGALLACASTQTAYQRQAQLAEQAYEQGDYALAAEHWRAAHQVAESRRDGDEARYRGARCLLRAGKTEEGEQLLSELAATGGRDRAPRAAFDLAFWEIENGDAARGHEQLLAALVRFPGHGVARDALRRRRAYLVETQGSVAAERDLAELGKRLRGTELESTAWFERAKLLEARGEDQRALSAYLDVAKRFPYPSGAYWNDATLAAARLEARLGQREAARKLLGQMLDQRESSALTGSYDRSYDQATYLLAELTLADGRWRTARDLWLGLVDDFPSSRLRDDALWAAALVSARNADADEACDLAERLQQETPDSRFAPCTKLVCTRAQSSTQPSGQHACADYVRRSFERGALRPPPTFR